MEVQTRSSDTRPLVGVQDIRESPLGTELSEAQCRKLAEVCSLVCVARGTFLLEEGHRDNLLYVVSNGSLEVTRPAAGSDEAVTLQLLHAGDMAGILGFIDRTSHSASIRALVDCELIALDREGLESLLQTDPEIVYQAMRSVVRTAHRILGRMNMQFVEMSNYISHQHGRY